MASDFTTGQFMAEIARNSGQAQDIVTAFMLPFHSGVLSFAGLFAIAFGLVGLMYVMVRPVVDGQTRAIAYLLQVAIAVIMLMPIEMNYNDPRLWTTTVPPGVDTSQSMGGKKFHMSLGTLYSHRIFGGMASMLTRTIDRSADDAKLNSNEYPTSALSVFNVPLNAVSQRPELLTVLNDYQRYCGHLAETPGIPLTTWHAMGLGGGFGLGVDPERYFKQFGRRLEPTDGNVSGALWIPINFVLKMFGNDELETGDRSLAELPKARELMQNTQLVAPGGQVIRPDGYQIIRQESWKTLLVSGDGSSPSLEPVPSARPDLKHPLLRPCTGAGTDAACGAFPGTNQQEFAETMRARYFPDNCADFYDVANMAMQRYLGALDEHQKLAVHGFQKGSSGYTDAVSSANSADFEVNAVKMGYAAVLAARNEFEVNREGYQAVPINNQNHGMVESGLGQGVSILIRVSTWFQEWITEFSVYSFVTMFALGYGAVIVLSPLVFLGAMLPNRGEHIFTVIQFFIFFKIAAVVMFLVIKAGTAFTVGLYHASTYAGGGPGSMLPLAILSLTSKLVVMAGIIVAPTALAYMLVFGEKVGLKGLSKNVMGSALAQGLGVALAGAKMAPAAAGAVRTAGSAVAAGAGLQKPSQAAMSQTASTIRSQSWNQSLSHPKLEYKPQNNSSSSGAGGGGSGSKSSGRPTRPK